MSNDIALYLKDLPEPLKSHAIIKLMAYPLSTEDRVKRLQSEKPIMVLRIFDGEEVTDSDKS